MNPFFRNIMNMEIINITTKRSTEDSSNTRNNRNDQSQRKRPLISGITSATIETATARTITTRVPTTLSTNPYHSDCQSSVVQYTQQISAIDSTTIILRDNTIKMKDPARKENILYQCRSAWLRCCEQNKLQLKNRVMIVVMDGLVVVFGALLLQHVLLIGMLNFLTMLFWHYIWDVFRILCFFYFIFFFSSLRTVCFVWWLLKDTCHRSTPMTRWLVCRKS